MKTHPFLALVCLLPALEASAEEAQSGTVEVPLPVYQNLVEASKPKTPSGPAAYAVGEATMQVMAGGDGAEVQVSVRVQILEDRWTLVPLLPAGTAVTQATVDGSPIQLVPTTSGLAFGAKAAGTHALELAYRVEVKRRGDGRVLPLPLPTATGTQLEARLPGAGLSVSVVPAAVFETSNAGEETLVTATIPSSSAAQIAWRTAERGARFAVSRARYQGALDEDAIAWTATFDAELFQGDATLPLIPKATTLSSLKVDGRPGTVLTEGERFATVVRGRGRHEIVIAFETPVLTGEGPPRAELSIPQIPISRFELRLPGRKELAVTPAASVRTRFDRTGTHAVIHAPMTGRLQMTWSEAVPEEAEEEVRANASIYHAAYAEEGVLHARATIDYQVTRGETSVVRFAAPADVQINAVSAENGAVSDWRVSKSGKTKSVSVFLDRKIDGAVKFDVRYERLTATGPNAPDIMGVPLLSMLDVHRQRGMVALLSSDDFSLKPTEQRSLSRVGENQLPPFFRGGLQKTVAHTFKYADVEAARLSVQAVAPERRQAKFEAQVDTLISLSDVTMKGSATVRINVKSGTMDVLRLELPGDVTLLNVTAPSKRSHSVKAQGDRQQVDLHFTQEMEGEFPVDLDYERIIAAGDGAETAVPIVRAAGAEPEQGRIAVEALTAVEVQPSTTEHLSLVDVSELPKQLVLKTRNPIRLAYKYVQPGHVLGLQITRHQELETQIATIERAHYQTLFTRDGLAVTTATFQVKNSRKQFLGLCLPEQSEIWSVFVDGKAEKPALDSREEKARPCPGLGVLIKVINSAQGFDVEMVYKTKVEEIGSLGAVQASLPRPDMVVTHTRWDVFLPDGRTYRTPKTNMDLVLEGRTVSRGQLERALSEKDAEQPLRVAVPMAGTQYAFEKLYANQSDEAPRIEIGYTSGEGEGVAGLMSAAGTLLFWAGLFLLLRRDRRIPPKGAGAATIAGGLIAGVSLYFLGGGAAPVIVSTIVALLAIAAFAFLTPRLNRRP